MSGESIKIYSIIVHLYLKQISLMPKLIDNYVLNRKIGAGQYGEVFRGYDRATNNQIAVKSIQRDKVKGKFRELLESEIKVLKSCENSNIIRLYDMKKTPNNFYLIMEYCNGGDLDAYVKKRKYLEEEEAIEFFCEMLHGFQHLYKHKILHRDLKLANILLHDGSVKIADFGFSKILDEGQLAATMLGSPLNMAPEVLQSLQYTNKADVYSLGVCYYWMLFGRPPFNARNIVELKSMIMKQDIIFPRNVNKISKMSEDLIRSMLKSKPQERISWQQLFKHPITTYLEKKAEQEMHLTLTMQGQFTENICKLYLNQNLVIIHPSQFNKKEDMMDFAVNRIKDGEKVDFKGNMIKKVAQKQQKVELKRQSVKDDGKLNDGRTEDEKILDEIQYNAFYLLSERNKIIFLLSVMNQLRIKKQTKGKAELLGTLAAMNKDFYQNLSNAVRGQNNVYGLKYWDLFVTSPSFKNIQHFLTKEETIVRFQFSRADKEAKKSNESLYNLVKNYVNIRIQLLGKELVDESRRQEWIHLCHLIDLTMLDKLMTQDFDFKHYYCDYGKYQMKDLVSLTKKRAKEL